MDGYSIVNYYTVYQYITLYSAKTITPNHHCSL